MVSHNISELFTLLVLRHIMLEGSSLLSSFSSNYYTSLKSLQTAKDKHQLICPVIDEEKKLNNIDTRYLWTLLELLEAFGIPGEEIATIPTTSFVRQDTYNSRGRSTKPFTTNINSAALKAYRACLYHSKLQTMAEVTDSLPHNGINYNHKKFLRFEFCRTWASL